MDGVGATHLNPPNSLVLTTSLCPRKFCRTGIFPSCISGHPWERLPGLNLHCTGGAWPGSRTGEQQRESRNSESKPVGGWVGLSARPLSLVLVNPHSNSAQCYHHSDFVAEGSESHGGLATGPPMRHHLAVLIHQECPLSPGRSMWPRKPDRFRRKERC